MKWNITTKVFAVTMIAVALIAGSGAVAWWKLAAVVDNGGRMSASNRALRDHMDADMMHDALRADVLAALRGAAKQDSAAVSAAAKDTQEHAGQFRKDLKENQERSLSPQITQACEAVLPALETYIRSAEAIVAGAASNVSEAERQFPAFLKLFSDLEGKMSELSDRIEEHTTAADQQNQRHVASFKQTLVAGTSAGLLLLVIVSVLVVRSIPRPFARVIGKLSLASEQNSDSSALISSASQSVAEGASEQAASLQETSASLEEMTSMLKKSAADAQTAKELARQTRGAADAGAVEMQQMREAMDAVKASSDNIAKIIKTIDEIAFQTNILALNAAVEAARAGEAGMGFAVVADEVRNLAQRSALAAKETADRIEDSIGKSEHGVASSARVAERLQEIVAKARQVDELIAGIAGAVSEQSQGIQQVNDAVLQIDKVTQKNAASAEESASAAVELQGQSTALRGAVIELENLVGGTSAARQAPGSQSSLDRPQLPTPKLIRSSSKPHAAQPRRGSIPELERSTASTNPAPEPAEDSFASF